MRYLLLTVFLSCLIPVHGQQSYPDSVICSNHIYNDKIKSVQLYKEGWNLSYPIIKLRSNEKLDLHFDLLDDQAETYYYTFIHCDKDWKKSDLFPNTYMTGTTENTIEDYETSFNTTVSYFHYKLSFPNDRINLSLSGNYIIMVYPADKPEEPAITQRFIITEDAIKISVNAHRPQMTKDNNSQQQVDFTVNYTGLDIIDPFRNVYAFILQNGRWDNAKRNLKPDFYGNNELNYNSLSDKNIFQGGNEYRYFDIKNLKYQTEFVKKIDYAVPYYNVYLYPSESRESKPYYLLAGFRREILYSCPERGIISISMQIMFMFISLSRQSKSFREERCTYQAISITGLLIKITL